MNIIVKYGYRCENIIVAYVNANIINHLFVFIDALLYADFVNMEELYNKKNIINDTFTTLIAEQKEWEELCIMTDKTERNASQTRNLHP